jgi:hypothetical protein
MKRRISLWALIGFAVAFVWFVVGLFTWPNYNLGSWTIVAVTAPASLIGRTMPLAYYWFILLNAAIYALVGLAAEVLRRPPAKHSSS